MTAPLGSAKLSSKNISYTGTFSVACVQTSKFSTAQGELIWEHGNMACIRAFSKHYVGIRIQAHSHCASPREP
jgi:hypothetical protein